MLDTKLYYENKNLAEDLRKGDANGWNSTADYEAGKIRRAQLNERLIRNAIARGDAVFEQP
jgi:hypothetical protein